jgi:hypothetical protein
MRNRCASGGIASVFAPALAGSVHYCLLTASRIDGWHVQVGASVPLRPRHFRDRGLLGSPHVVRLREVKEALGLEFVAGITRFPSRIPASVAQTSAFEVCGSSRDSRFRT